MLLGSQEPLYQFVPPARSSAGQEAIDLAASAGLILEPHQQLVLHGVLGERRDGKWAARRVGVIEPRQNGKGGIITARQLAGLYLFGEPVQTHTAHRFDTCLEAFRRIAELIEGSPDLMRRVKNISYSHGQEAVELVKPTQRLLFKARSKGSGRGFSGDTVYLDEAFWLLELGSLVPTMRAQPNPQLWMLSSAPLPRVESDILRRLCRQGRAGALRRSRPRSLAYFEWCAKVGADPADFEAWEAEVAELLDDQRAWAQANPGLGYRITLEAIQADRDAMTDEEFARECLGIYRDIEGPVDTAIDAGDWGACEDRRSKAIDPVVFGFEVSADRKTSTIGAAGISTEGGTHVEVVERRRGTKWVVPWLLSRQDKHKPAAIVCDPSGPAGSLLKDCEQAGLVVGIPDGRTPKGEAKYRPVTARDYVQACGAVVDDVADRRWRHLGQPELNAAVGAAGKKATGKAWIFDPGESTVDLAPLKAVTLAAWAAGRVAPPMEADFILI